jgi:hypothetical protein
MPGRPRVGEHLAGLAGDGRVARDEHVHQPAESLDAEAQRRDVQQDHLAAARRSSRRLDRRAERDGLVRMLGNVRLALNSSATAARTAGMRVLPPTSTTASSSAA